MRVSSVDVTYGGLGRYDIRKQNKTSNDLASNAYQSQQLHVKSDAM